MNQTQTSAGQGNLAAYFQDHSDAHRALEALGDAGFSSAHVGIAHSGHHNNHEANTSIAGEKTHSAWDKIKSFFEGGSAEPYAEEKTRGDLATREITTTPGDASYGSHEDLHGNLTSLSIPEDRSRYFADRFRSNANGAIVTVNPGSRYKEAEEILTRFGGDLGDNASQSLGATGETAGIADRTTGTNQPEGTRNIQLLGEMLRVHKDRISRGDVVVRKEVISETQTLQVPVTREELVIERHPGAGSTKVQGAIGENTDIRIPLSEETASVETTPVVREEVAIGKKPVSEVRELTGEVRHEDLVVDDQTRKVSNG